MSLTYWLDIYNFSQQKTNFCLFFRNPAQAYDLNLHSVAWISKEMHPDTSAKFGWDLDYGLMYYKTGVLKPGICLQYSTEETYRLGQDNTVLLTEQSGKLQFNKLETHTPQGFYAVYTDDTILPYDISLGINISNQPAFVCQATPNCQFTFVPQMECWIARGNFATGEVLEFDQMIDAYKIEFPYNCFSKTLHYEPKCPWTESN